VINTCLYTTDFSPTFSDIKKTRATLLRLLKKYQLSESVKNNLLLALSEYLNNIVIHSQPRANNIAIEVFKDVQYLSFVVKDDGGHFFALSDQHLNRQQPVFKESGMGLDIIFHLFPSCSYNQDNKCNIFKLRIVHHHAKPIQRIAVIDDDAVQRKVLTAYLSDKYEVVSYCDGENFLTHGLKEGVDLVICDIEMPKVDGLGVKIALKKDHEMSQVPFIFLTANDDMRVEISANELGIDNYLTKPISKQKLLISIERVLVRNQQLNYQHQQLINNALSPQVINNNPHYCMALKTISPAIGGGDFIVQKTLADRTIIILADVMGHDVTSKFFAHSFDGFIKGLIEQSTALNIATIFKLLSKQVYNDPLLSQMLLTCVGVELFPDHINMVSAGHPCPVIFSPGKHQEVNIIGRLPGLCADSTYHTTTFSLAVNQQLLLFTDGFFDWTTDKDSKQHFLDKLVNTCDVYSNSDLSQLANEFFNEFSVECQQPKDDMTFMLLKNK
jgi:CheY-like chemotaxis protein